MAKAGDSDEAATWCEQTVFLKEKERLFLDSAIFSNRLGNVASDEWSDLLSKTKDCFLFYY